MALSVSDSRAEGIPIDLTRTKITTDHKVFSMTADQVEEAVAFRTVTLTAAQWADMRKEFPGFPKRVEVVTHQYNDCSCGLSSAFGIWLPDRKLGIPTRWLKKDKITTSIEHGLKTKGFCAINVDHRGQFYKDGKLVPFAVLKEQIRAGIKGYMATKDGVHIQLFVGYPAEMNEKSVTLAARVGELRKMVEEVGGSLSGW